jgi:uncharacterized protein
MRCLRCGGETAERAVRMRRSLALVVFAVGLAASWVVLGDVLQDTIEGMDRTGASRWPLAIPAAILLGGVFAWTLRLKRPVCEACGAVAGGRLLAPLARERSDRLLAMPARRRVLGQLLGTLTATVAAAAGAIDVVAVRHRGWLRVGRELFREAETAAPAPRPEWTGSRVRSQRRLGRTGAMVSDISLGSASIRSAEVPRLALERGVTYFDTSPDYSQHGSEEILGDAMRGRRDEVFVASKFCTADGHLPPDTPVPRIIEAVEGSLRRLRTDRIDLLHIHACDRVERLLAPNFHEAFDRLRDAGKARFLGVSTHTPNLPAVANAAIDSGRFDVLMLAYHHGIGWGLEQIIERAAAHDLGVVAMKTLKGARHENLGGFRDQATSYTQAAFRWVLSNPHVSCLVISFSEPRHVDEYLHASGTQLTAADHAVLARYDALIAGEYCRPHCGACLDTCVASLPIDDVLRYRMYLEDYRNADEARRLYAALGERSAAHCLGCPAPCAEACPYGLPIQEKMLGAHALLARA